MKESNRRLALSLSYNNTTTPTNNNNNNNKNKNTITILNPYNFSINFNFIKIINNYNTYSYSYKSLNKLLLYKDNFTTLPSFFKIVIVKFSLKILLVDKAINIAKKHKVKII
ncbi:hypothetical protein C8035_v005767 [Colletotrichum spinosum]|uniref:Uncharacterized protein n=1 Tax=Colletotrichum spinosum TaxID=1347390 RepID=A0A4R8PPE8_9PEZI|nr:hypothetical protein C8035_v005767 [Colletotrichum spinosum]